MDSRYSVCLLHGAVSFNGDELYPNEEGLKFYDDVFDELLAHGIQPLVTMSHYEPPIHLVLKYNGWYARELVFF